jgi:hypothetical protein
MTGLLALFVLSDKLGQQAARGSVWPGHSPRYTPPAFCSLGRTSCGSDVGNEVAGAKPLFGLQKYRQRLKRYAQFALNFSCNMGHCFSENIYTADGIVHTRKFEPNPPPYPLCGILLFGSIFLMCYVKPALSVDLSLQVSGFEEVV